MKKALANYRTAVLVCVGLILLTFLFGPHLSLSKLQAGTERVFTSGGALGEQYSLENDLYTLGGHAANLLTIADQAGADTPAAGSVRSALTAIEQADTITAYHTAYENLNNSFRQLKEDLASVDLTSQQEEYVTRLSTDYEGTRDIISRNEYNESATRYNETLSSMPAKLYGKKSLDTFTK